MVIVNLLFLVVLGFCFVFVDLFNELNVPILVVTCQLIIFVSHTRKALGHALNPLSILALSLFAWHIPFLLGYLNYGSGVFAQDGGVLGFESQVLVYGSLYCVLCISMFLFGGSVGIRGKALKYLADPSVATSNKKVPHVYIVLFFLCSLVLVVNSYLSGRFSGAAYMDLYINNKDNLMNSLFSSTQFVLPLLLLYFLTQASPSRHQIVSASWILVLLISLLGGDRSLPFMLLLTVIVVKDIKNPISFPKLLAVGILFSMLSRVITETRKEGVGLNLLNPNVDMDLLHLFWEMGRSINTVFMSIDYTGYNIFPGQSFLVSGFSVFPGFTRLVTDLFNYVRPSQWLVDNSLGLATGEGFGFSVVAETYLNFGLFGIFLFFILGYFIGRTYKRSVVRKKSIMFLFILYLAILLALGFRNDSESYARQLLMAYPILILLFYARQSELWQKMMRYKR